MPVALFLSPHLDDAVFSCGGLAASLAGAGWTTVLVTAFTRSVVPATGFALACQLDKGLAPDVDYMALRRAEDVAAAAILSFGALRWLDLPEAPHRGYGSAAELFREVLDEDTIGVDLTAHLIALAAEFEPSLVLAPQGLGNHVDHQHVGAAARMSFAAEHLAYYRDTPYAIRQPGPEPLVVAGVASVVPIAAELDRKVAAAQAYTSQIGFQFGGAVALDAALRGFAIAEGRGVPAERFCGCDVAGLVCGVAA